MDELDRYRPSIEAVSAADVQSAAERHIHPDELAIVLVGDADAITPALEDAAVGPVTIEREELPGQGA
jgi:zinc protease